MLKNRIQKRMDEFFSFNSVNIGGPMMLSHWTVCEKNERR